MVATGNRAASRLYGRERDLKYLREYVQNGTSCQIVGPRGIGKTALMQALVELAPTWDSRLFVAYLDLSDPRCHTVNDFWQMAWQAWEQGAAPVSAAERSEVIAQWYKKGKRPVLCLDGFEHLINRPKEFTTYFYLDLRSMAGNGLCMVTASNDTLSQLMPFYNPTSPFFNVFANVQLGPMPREDAEDFLTTISAETLPLTSQERNAILDFAEAHRSAYPLALQTATTQVIQAKRADNDMSFAMHKASEALKKGA